MVMKWQDGNVSLLRKFRALFCSLCLCMPSCHVREAEKWLQADSWLSFYPPGATAETQSHNNGCLFLPGKRWGGWWGWKGAAGGVYLSHGNWFAGVEVGSFEKTSFSLTHSHLSVWKAAGRKGRRMESGVEGERKGGSEGVLLQRHFHTKAGECEWVCLKAQSDASLKWRILFASCQVALTFYHLASSYGA